MQGDEMRGKQVMINASSNMLCSFREDYFTAEIARFCTVNTLFFHVRWLNDFFFCGSQGLNAGLKMALPAKATNQFLKPK